MFILRNSKKLCTDRRASEFQNYYALKLCNLFHLLSFISAGDKLYNILDDLKSTLSCPG